MNKTRLTGILLLAAYVFPLAAQDTGTELSSRWSKEKANQWYADQDWPCGFNYVPANAISYTEMWMPYCFDRDFIDQELALAEAIGFNCLRVVLPFIVWEQDPDSFKGTIREFLEICDSHGIRVLFTLFDDCAFGSDPRLKNPWYGQQPEVLEGWYANGWTPSPGHDLVRDSSSWPRLESYVKDLISTFGNDIRVWIWDLYNEPTNGGLGNQSMPLVEKVFQWARTANPSQPLTIAQWNGNVELNRLIHGNSDITSFHSYSRPAELRRTITELKSYERPIINTEWLNRSIGSEVSSCLPVFLDEDVGCMLWGLVNGKTQTHLHWGWRPGMGEPDIWQHDLFLNDHRPYNKRELNLIKSSILKKTGRLPDPPVVTPGQNGTWPSDAIVLFDQDTLINFVSVVTGEAPEWTVAGDVFTVKPETGSIESRQKFGDCQLHIEWRTSEQDVLDGKTGQQCSNSGIYLMGKYEIQVLNSFENETYPDGQAGAFYGNSPPLVNASLKPGEWQVYDIIFMAPQFNDKEVLIEPGYFTLFHNGLLVLNHVKITNPTPSHNEAYSISESELPLMLQDHKSEVSYRNIWIRKL